MDLTCKYTFWKGTKKGQRCPHRPRGGEYCYQHRDTAEAHIRGDRRAGALAADPIFNPASQPEDPEKEAIPGIPGEKHRPERTSIWHWTINSNQPYERMLDEDKLKFKSYIDKLMSGQKILDYIQDRTAPDLRNIDDVKVDHYFEVSPTAGLLHAHGYLSLKHRGFMTIQLNRLRADTLKEFGKNMHMHFPVNSDAEQAWQAYISKHSEAQKIQL